MTLATSDTTTIDRPPSLGGDAARFALAVGSALLATAVGLSVAVVLAGGGDEWWRGLLAAGVASTLAAAMSAGPILWGLGRGTGDAAAVGYFVALGVRAIVSLAGCGLAVYAGAFPRTPTFLLMVPFYFAVLAAETAVVARAVAATKT